MKKGVLGTLFLIGFIASVSATEYTPNTIIFNGSFGAGTFSAGEYDGGSAFLGSSLSVDADIFILAKLGWAFGIWNSKLDKDSYPNGIVGGINFGGRYFLTPLISLYAELGYNYYGLARSDIHPEYPFGYGSGKLYASLGLSLKLSRHKGEL